MVETVVISGNKGLGPYIVKGSAHYDATNASVEIEHRGDNNCKAPTGFRLNNGNNSTWKGGLVYSKDTIEVEWTASKHCGGAGFFLDNSANVKVEGVEMHHPHDGCRPAGSSANPVFERMLMENVRDDAFECDNRNGVKSVKVLRSYISGHTLVSTRRGGAGRVGDPPPVYIHFEDCIFEALEQRNSRDKRDYPWNSTNYGHGQIFKTEVGGAFDTVFLKNCVIAERSLPKQTKSNHRVIKPNATIAEGSGNNIYVWLGSQTSAGNGGIPMVEVDGVKVPESLGLHTSKLRAIFTVTDDLKVLNDAKADWFANVWEGEDPGDPDDPGEPDEPGDPDCDCEVLEAEIARLQAQVDKYEEALRMVEAVAGEALE